MLTKHLKCGGKCIKYIVGKREWLKNSICLNAHLVYYIIEGLLITKKNSNDIIIIIYCK